MSKVVQIFRCYFLGPINFHLLCIPGKLAAILRNPIGNINQLDSVIVEVLFDLVLGKLRLLHLADFI